jgi:thiol-disulfide isomerase/thioredoxin
MKKIAAILFAAFFAATLFLPLKSFATEQKIIFFWAEGCPHCAAESVFLEKLVSENSGLSVEKHEVSKSKENQQLLVDWSKKLNFDPNGVPVTIIGEKYVLGYMDGVTDSKIESFLASSADIKGSGEVCAIDRPCDDKEVSNHKIKLPFFGEIETKNFSLPILSIVIGILDGFNPCAMWTLLFLISLLLGMKDRKRMWILGFAFIVASAAVYFIFMSAWLNLLLFIGLIATVRIIIGLVSLGGGMYSLKDFATNKEGGCKVTDNEKRKATFEKIKHIVHERSFILALFGIIILAFAVNLVELICSAGLPAVYTQILTMSNLHVWQYYLYILLYVFFFMLDDLIIFFIAMFTLQLTGITTRYSRISRLVGGILMLVIGLILIFKPSWLMFG